MVNVTIKQGSFQVNPGLYILAFGVGARGPGAGFWGTNVRERQRGVCDQPGARAERRARKRACGSSEALWVLTILYIVVSRLKREDGDKRIVLVKGS